MTDIAKQLLACKQWRWMPGMRARQVDPDWVVGDRASSLWSVDRAKREERLVWHCESGATQVDLDPGQYPDLDDAATVGCLWAMLVDAHEGMGVPGTPSMHCSGINGHTVVIKYLDATWREHNGSSHGEAIARALLHVWGT